MFGQIFEDYRANKELVHAYLRGDSVENYDNDINVKYGAMAAFVFLVLLAVAITLWAVIALMGNWKRMPDWARLVSVLALLGPLGGPVVALIVVYVTRNGRRN